MSVRVAGAWWLAAGLLAGVLCVPFLLTPIPPVVDYPNHLARAVILAFGADDPVLSRMFAPHWAILPNLATDLVLPPLLAVVPVEVAGRLVLAAAMLLPLAGVVLYNRALFRAAGPAAWWPFAAVLVAFNGAFLLGLMNFLFSVAAAFATAAGWLRWRDSRPVGAVLGTSAGAVVVFFCHISGLALLATLLAANELDRAMRGDRRRPGWRLVALAAPFALPCLLFAASPTAHASGGTEWLPSLSKLFFALAPMMNYDLATDAAAMLLLLAAIGLGLWRRWLVMPRATAIGLAVLLLAFLLAPYRLQGGAFADYRFIIMAGYLVFAGVRESRLAAPRHKAVLFAALGLVFCWHTGGLAWAWDGEAADVGAMRAAVAPVPAGSRVLIASVGIEDAPAYWRGVPAVRMIDGVSITDLHLPVLMLVEQRAMAQSLFTDPAQQPITVLPRYAASATLEAAWGVPSYTLLAGPLPARAAGRFPYLQDWPAKFDFVLVLNAGGMADPAGFLPDRLALVRASDLAALYRVR